MVSFYVALSYFFFVSFGLFTISLLKFERPTDKSKKKRKIRREYDEKKPTNLTCCCCVQQVVVSFLSFRFCLVLCPHTLIRATCISLSFLFPWFCELLKLVETIICYLFCCQRETPKNTGPVNKRAQSQ